MSWHEQFDRCAPWIKDALEYSGGTHSLEDVRAQIASGHAQIWPAEKAVVVTEIRVHPRKKVCNFWLAGGDLDQILDMLPHMESWAKDNGCDATTLNGRVGWKKVLKDYQPQAMSFTKEINHE